MTKNFDDVKKLGFGLMRLPQKEGVIDVERVKTMVDMFLDAGFNYFDTAFAYAGSEDAIRQALVNRVPREKFFLATKNAAWLNCKTKDDAVAQFETSLKQTGAGYADGCGLFRFLSFAQFGRVAHALFRRFRYVELDSGEEARGACQTRRLFLSFHAARA